jgi:hypothetical protein
VDDAARLRNGDPPGDVSGLRPDPGDGTAVAPEAGAQIGVPGHDGCQR